MKYHVILNPVTKRWHAHLRTRNGRTICSTQARGYAQRKTALRAIDIMTHSYLAKIVINKQF